MNYKLMVTPLLAGFILCGSCVVTYAQAVLDNTVWLVKEKTSKIQIYKATDGKYYGKIIWLLHPNENGKPKVDKNNPDPAHRNDPMLGLVLLKHFVKKSDKKYDEGAIYDPRNGKIYSCNISFEGDKLEVRGYVGFSLLGQTTTWTRAE